MTDTFNKLKEELRDWYPGITDVDLNDATERLIKFFAIGAKMVFEAKCTVRVTENN